MSDRVAEILDTSSDQFQQLVADTITNEADLAGHYPYSPERFRVLVNGTRQFIQYDGAPTEYEDTVDGHLLKPQSEGDVVTLETTERFRYVVGYTVRPSFAWAVNQDLQDGDVVALSYGNADLENATGTTPGPNADGWILYTNADHADNEATLAMYRAGTVKASTTVSFQKAHTVLTRLAEFLNWYNVGAAEIRETYTRDGTQHNATRGTTSVDSGKGPETANKPMQFSVKTGATGAGSLELEVGSVAVQTLGNVIGITRVKRSRFVTSIDTANTWVPIGAIRVDPDRVIVNVQLTELDIREYSTSNDVRVLALSMSPDKLRDSGVNPLEEGDWSTPNEMHVTNSVLEETSAVAQFPDVDGTIVTSATDPGGYQVGYSSLYTSNTGQERTAGGDFRARKRQVNDRDVVVFLANAGGTGTITMEYAVEQDW